MTDHSRQLGEGSIPRLLLRFSIPAIVGMVAHSLYNVVDRIFVGRAAGVEGIAAITVCLPAMLIIMGFVMLIGLGANSLVSIKLGERKRRRGSGFRQCNCAADSCGACAFNGRAGVSGSRSANFWLQRGHFAAFPFLLADRFDRNGFSVSRFWNE